jgi:hypothetical protein
MCHGCDLRVCWDHLVSYRMPDIAGLTVYGTADHVCAAAAAAACNFYPQVW